MKLYLAFLLFVPTFSFAKTIFEPSLSLGAGLLDKQTAGGDTADEDDDVSVSLSYTALSAGMRYGITRDYIHVTGIVDAYMVNQAAPKIGSGVSQVEGEAKTDIKANVGLGIGYEWNIPLRTYLILGFPFSSAEISYYWSESVLIGFKVTRMEMQYEDTKVQFNNFGVAISFPFEFDYPSYWWRKKDWE